MLFIVIPDHALIRFLVEPLLQIPDIKIIVQTKPPRGARATLLRLYDFALGIRLSYSLYLGGSLTQQLKAITRNDTVLFFAIENLKELLLMRSFVQTTKLKLWLWNPVSSFRTTRSSQQKYVDRLRKEGIDAATFDPMDAQQLGLGLQNQVFRQVAPTPQDGLQFDVTFAGVDKGRLGRLDHWHHVLTQMGLRVHMHVVADRRKRYGNKGTLQVTHRWLAYEEYLALMQSSACILELLQNGQHGLTLRGLEAAFLNKKLITDNPSYLDTPLYSPDRIFILGRDDVSMLPAFLRSSHLPLSPEALRPFDIAEWIKHWQA
ncbi:MAG: hypothetical protein U5L74_01685 [Ideonella sp.]|nr:hypothetical protein [Ideonella sp.]